MALLFCGLISLILGAALRFWPLAGPVALAVVDGCYAGAVLASRCWFLLCVPIARSIAPRSPPKRSPTHERQVQSPDQGKGSPTPEDMMRCWRRLSIVPQERPPGVDADPGGVPNAPHAG